MLLIQEFIKNNPSDWMQILDEEFNIMTKIKVINNQTFYLLKYNHIGADWYNPMVRECRGIILDSNFQVRSLPFYKFGNYGEGYNTPLDINSIKILEKVDGSLISLWWNGFNWMISTSGNVDASDSPINNGDKTYYDVFNEALEADLIRLNGLLDTNCCYVFELVSPETQVVVPYPKPMLFHLTSRNLDTLEEFEIDLGISKPKVYEFKTLEDCIKASKELAWNDEGYVAVDKYYNRAKIKSPAWVAAHVSGEVLKTSNRDCRLLDIALGGELQEYLTYFPSYREKLEEINELLLEEFKTVEKTLSFFHNTSVLCEQNQNVEDYSQKEKAFLINNMSKNSSSYVFQMIKKPNYIRSNNWDNYIEWLKGRTSDFQDRYIANLRKELPKENDR